MEQLNKLVNDMIEEHEGGEEFFNNLDESIRDDPNYLYMVELVKMFQEAFISDKKTNIPLNKYRIVVSGRFGTVFSNWARSVRFRYQIIEVNGGLRHGDVIPLDAFLEDISGYNFIFFDDSFYSGRTRDKVYKEIERLGGKAIGTCVVYDGSKERDDDVHSLYRYYE